MSWANFARTAACEKNVIESTQQAKSEVGSLVQSLIDRGGVETISAEFTGIGPGVVPGTVVQAWNDGTINKLPVDSGNWQNSAVSEISLTGSLFDASGNHTQILDLGDNCFLFLMGSSPLFYARLCRREENGVITLGNIITVRAHSCSYLSASIVPGLQRVLCMYRPSSDNHGYMRCIDYDKETLALTVGTESARLVTTYGYSGEILPVDQNNMLVLYQSALAGDRHTAAVVVAVAANGNLTIQTPLVLDNADFNYGFLSAIQMDDGKYLISWCTDSLNIKFRVIERSGNFLLPKSNIVSILLADYGVSNISSYTISRAAELRYFNNQLIYRVLCYGYLFMTLDVAEIAAGGDYQISVIDAIDIKSLNPNYLITSADRSSQAHIPLSYSLHYIAYIDTNQTALRYSTSILTYTVDANGGISLKEDSAFRSTGSADCGGFSAVLGNGYLVVVSKGRVTLFKIEEDGKVFTYLRDLARSITAGQIQWGIAKKIGADEYRFHYADNSLRHFTVSGLDLDQGYKKGVPLGVLQSDNKTVVSKGYSVHDNLQAGYIYYFDTLTGEITTNPYGSAKKVIGTALTKNVLLLDEEVFNR